MIIEPITQNDINTLKELQPEGWPDIIPIFQSYLKSSIFYPRKILIKNKIIGIGTGIVFGKTAWLAHIIVKPECRSIGIGLKIVVELMKIIQELGCETISLIATELGQPVYKKAGFSIQTEYVFFEREKQWINNEPSKNIIEFSSLDTPQILALDKKVSGENRSPILVDKLLKTYVYRNGTNIEGFYIPKVGEGLIIADNKKAGIELMKVKYAITNKAVLPIENLEGIKFLKDNGFVETIRAKRMVLGKKFRWCPEKIYSRIAGNFG